MEETTSVSGDISSGDVNVHPIDLDNSNSKDVYLSIVCYCGYLGAAYYESDTAILYFMLETIETSPFNQTKNLIEELKPTAVITSAKQDGGFIAALREHSNYENNRNEFPSEVGSKSNVSVQTSGNVSVTCILEMLSSIEYNYEASKRRIVAVKLPEIPDHYTDMERVIHLSSLVPLECTVTVRAAGGLIRYLEKKQIGVMLEGVGAQTPISSFQTFTLKNVVHIDKASYQVLQVFHRIRHPSAYKASSREGLSLFGILNRTTTLAGYKLMKTWFYRPTADRDVLNRRLDAVAYFVDPGNEEISKQLRDCLKQVKNVTRLIAKIKTGKLTVTDWFGLWHTAESLQRIADVCRSVAASNACEGMPMLFQDIINCSPDDLIGIVSMISSIMDVDASKQENRFVVFPGISMELDEMKETYARLPAILGVAAQKELENFNEYLTVCQIVYMRRIGYLLFTRKTESMKQSNDLKIPGTEFVAATDETVYYKTPATEKLDDEYGDILENIAYHEMEITNQLQDMILQHSGVFIEVMKCTAQLDCLLSFGIVAKEFNYIRPLLTDTNEIHITGSRHPLQEHAVSLFVPNDIHFGSHAGLLKILTGPNASGKSVYLKQVGLIVLMAHIGCYVPAEKAVISMVSRIYTMIRSCESLSSGLSTFANDLSRMSIASREAGRGSLVLIDEFGKGTAAVDGVGLLTSCLNHLIEKKEATPMVICATHFHSLAQQNSLLLSEAVRFQIMDTITTSKSETVYLYQLTDGVSERSHASHVARTAGIPGEIITRGQEVSEIIRRNTSVRQYNRPSTITYQNRCNEVVDRVLNSNIKENLKQLLINVKSIMSASKQVQHADLDASTPYTTNNSYAGSISMT